jgi:hypothetical protein
MNDLGAPFISLAVVFLLFLFTLFLFGVRRFQLRRALGTLDASICLSGGGWRLGVCRYRDNELEWFRMLSLSPRPRHRFLRSSMELTGRRQPTEVERSQIQPGAVVVQLRYEGQEWLMAMNFDAYAGLSSWLEAGPVIGVGTWR